MTVNTNWRFMIHFRSMWLRFSMVIAGLALYGCSFNADYGDAKTASETFHHLMDTGKYAAIYDDAAKDFQSSLSRDQLAGFLARVNREMGTCSEPTISFGQNLVTPSGTFVSMNSSRACSNGKLEEQFVWLMVAGKATLFKYAANSPLLLTD